MIEESNPPDKKRTDLDVGDHPFAHRCFKDQAQLPPDSFGTLFRLHLGTPLWWPVPFSDPVEAVENRAGANGLHLAQAKAVKRFQLGS
jgi:hypothetical protein